MTSPLEVHHPDGVGRNKALSEGVHSLDLARFDHIDARNLGVKPVAGPALAPFVRAMMHDALVLTASWSPAKPVGVEDHQAIRKQNITV